MTGKIAYAADRVFDGERVLEKHAVVVEDGTVRGVVAADTLGADVKRVVEKKATVIPGLMDSHIHFMRWEGALFLAHGVTSVRDAGNGLEWILKRRGEWEERGWPRIRCLGAILDGPQVVHPGVVSVACRDPAGAVAAVRDAAAAGVDGIKLYVGIRKEWLAAMAARAHEAGLKVSIHCQGTGVEAVLRAGVDESYHLDGVLTDVWPDHPGGWLELWGRPEFAGTWKRQKKLADDIAEARMTVTPTLAFWDSQGLNRADVARAQQWRRALEMAQKFIGLLLERKVPVLAGTDVPCGGVTPGLSLWREMALLCGAGMSAMQALRAATVDVAGFYGDEKLGRLKVGSPADLVIVGGNPTEKIPERPEIRMVVRAGRLFGHEELLASAEREAEVTDDPWGAEFPRGGKGTRE